MKERHDLWQSNSASDFISRSSAMGIDLIGTTNSLTRTPEKSSLMLVGSIAESMATPESDIDLLLLVEKEDQLDYSNGVEWSFSSGEPYKPVTVKIFPKGIEFDIEICVLEKAGDLLGSVGKLMDFMGNTSSIDGIPKLQTQEIRFIHQLRSGWKLSNESIADYWQSSFQTKHLPLYSMVNNFIEYMELLEDVISAERKHNLLDVSNIGRICSEHLAMTLLGMGGFTNPNRKWLAHALFDLKKQRPEFAGPTDQAIHLLFPPAHFKETEASQYINQLKKAGEQLRILMNRDARLSNMLDLLFSKLHYIM